MRRPPLLRAFALAPNELVVDNFAGGGGASTGIEEALGRPVDIAINHDREALAVHAANHPNTKHYCEDIWTVDPREACRGRSVGLAWFSPDCTHFSRAKGAKPREKSIRGLAWVVVRWAREVGPRVIILENVEEFQTWGPLREDGLPDKTRAGETFREWLVALHELGYSIEFRSLTAADYGAPTIRKRLFLIARRDGRRAAWPMATHGAGAAESWRPAREIIDWSLPCPSIFGRKRPLAEATQRRIAAGVKRYVIDAAEPFVLPLTHHGDARVHSVREPLRTVTGAHRGELALAVPFLAPVKSWGGGGNKARSLALPMRTVTASKGGEHALVATFLTKHYGGVVGHDLFRPIGTVTAQDHHSLTAAFLTKFYGTSVGSALTVPAPTITGHACGGHLGEVRAFLTKYYGAGGKPQVQGVDEPLHTVTAKARYGLVIVEGEPYAIYDIGMRMLQPLELFRAQGFPDDYEIMPEVDGEPLTKTAQTRLAGNSVCPPVAAALVRSNLAEAA